MNKEDARAREKYLKSGMGKRYLKNRLKRFLSLTGFTLMEVIIVIALLGILAAIAVRLVDTALDRSRFETTNQEMKNLVFAIVGNPSLTQGGLRSDFAYVGDCAALPSTFDDLVTDPGATGWNGPYISNEFTQDPDDFKTDAWGTGYDASIVGGALVIISYGSDGVSGGTGYAADISKVVLDPIANATTNSVEVRVRDGHEMTLIDDHVSVAIEYPQGTSHSLTYGSGCFSLTGTVPIGNWKITVTPTPAFSSELGSALESMISVYPRGSTPASGTKICFVGVVSPGLMKQADWLDLSYFDFYWHGRNRVLLGMTLTNTDIADPIVIDKINVSWSRAVSTEKIRRIVIDNTTVWDRDGTAGSPSGEQESGTTLDIEDVTLADGEEDTPIDYMWFNTRNLDGRAFQFIFTMGDGSSKTVTTFPVPER